MEQHPPAPGGLIRTLGYAYFPIAFIARLPFAMNVVGVLTLVVAARGSLTLGGLTSAACGIGTALVGPLLGAAADRFGQRRVLLLAGVGNAAALLLMAWVAFAPVADVWLLAAALLIGATAPQVSPLSRTRLVATIQRSFPVTRRGQLVSSTLAYESAADEIVFVFGPVIVGLLATTLNPAAPLIAAAVLTFFAVGAFAFHPSAKTAELARTHETQERAPVRALFRPRVLVLVGGMLSIGAFFGSSLTSLTSFMRDLGEAESAGVFYGVMGVGSAILALSVTIMPRAFRMRTRWVVFAMILTAGALLIMLARDIPAMVVALALTGIGIGPLVVTIYTFATLRTPVGRAATVMTMVSSGVVVGQSISSAITGSIATTHGTAAALIVPFIAALLVLLLGSCNWFLDRGRTHDA